MIRKITMVAASLILSQNAQAKEMVWTNIGSTKAGVSAYLSFDGSQVVGNIARIWVKFEHPPERGLVKEVTLEEIDCKNDKIRSIQSVGYSVDGTSIWLKPEDWETPFPETFARNFVDIVCRR